MSRLLRANFARIFKSWYFQLGAVIFIVVNFIVPFSTYRDMQKYPEFYHHDYEFVDELTPEERDEYIRGMERETLHEGYMFSTGLFLPFITTVVIGLFIGTDYSDGTIRNKLVVGHKRKNVYLSNLITAISVSELIYLAGLATSYITARILFDNTILPASEIFMYILAGIFVTASWAAICTSVSMLFHSKAGCITLTLLFACAMSVFSAEIIMSLENPLYYDETVYMNSATEEIVQLPTTIEKMTPNDLYMAGIDPEEVDQYVSQKEEDPNVPHGIKRKVFKLINVATPGCQYIHIGDWEKSYNDTTILWSSLVILAVTSAGIFVFRKQNLK
ncbi:MAG: ABC transporter permease subunit [Ruminococcus sp.]|nr:ABC transporter permease subunit [Ruminococcus sp.]